jgi:hypothetical protein
MAANYAISTLTTADVVVVHINDALTGVNFDPSSTRIIMLDDF